MANGSLFAAKASRETKSKRTALRACDQTSVRGRHHPTIRFNSVHEPFNSITSFIEFDPVFARACQASAAICLDCL
jgi:hypothetical protein